MSSSRGLGNSSNSSGKQKITSEITTPTVDEINLGVEDMGLNSEPSEGWEVYGKKPKNKAGGSGAGKKVLLNPNAKAWGNQNTKAWGHTDVIQKLGMRNNVGYGRGSGNNRSTPDYPRKPAGRGNTSQIYDQPFGNSSAAVVPPALRNGWDWSARAAKSHPTEEGTDNKEEQDSISFTDDVKESEQDDEDNESELLDDTDDELLSDESDSGVNETHETRKKKPWFKDLFESLDKLTVAELNDPERQWHCPACKGGPGEILWFTGLQSLVTHAKTKGVRVKLHRELAELLEEELRERGTSVVPPGEMYGIWDGPEFKDKDIVWPPMVIIMNTRHDKDDNDKWIGMGNQELLDYFGSYAAVRARHSYGPKGHRGMSVLIFEASAVGYIEAERLSEHFYENGRSRDAWERHPVRFFPGGKRQLYGYMAEKRDMDDFNQHSPGKTKLKFEIKSYLETVLKPAKQMRDDNQLLTWFKNKAAKHQMHAKVLQESLTLVTEKHRQTLEETKIVRLKTKMHHEQIKEEMEYQEQFFKNQLKAIYDARVAAEDNFEKIQQEQRELVKHSNADTSSVEDHRHRVEKVTKFIQLQDKEMDMFVEERNKLMKAHEEKVAAIRLKYWEEEVKLEKEFDLELAKLMNKYSPPQSEE